MNNIFNLDESYITDVRYHEEYSMFRFNDELTPEEIIKVLKGEDRISIFGYKEHPEFAKFRKMLGTEGYINIERNWHNGDVVIKRFWLNGVLFEECDRFPSSAAMRSWLEWKRDLDKYV